MSCYRKMRLMTALFRNSRHPQCENKVPIKPTMPLKLKEWLPGKNNAIKGISLRF